MIKLNKKKAINFQNKGLVALYLGKTLKTTAIVSNEF